MEMVLFSPRASWDASMTPLLAILISMSLFLFIEKKRLPFSGEHSSAVIELCGWAATSRSRLQKHSKFASKTENTTTFYPSPMVTGTGTMPLTSSFFKLGYTCCNEKEAVIKLYFNAKNVIPNKIPSFQQAVTELNLRFFSSGKKKFKYLISQKAEYFCACANSEYVYLTE